MKTLLLSLALVLSVTALPRVEEWVAWKQV